MTNSSIEETHYLRDGNGNILATYENKTAKEFVIYGSSRLGTYNGNTSQGKRTLGNKKYELSNHLGNVLSVISDNKIGIDNVGDDFIADIYEPLVISESDYYPYGMHMKERSFSNEEYRFGFNTQEKTPEIGKDTYTAEFWQYDSRIARRWNVDPVDKPYEADYMVIGNNPIWATDVKGDDWYKNKKYNPEDKDSKEYEWFEGNGDVEGYEHLGEFLVIPNSEDNTLKIHYQKIWEHSIELDSDAGRKFRIIAAESNFDKDKKTGEIIETPFIDMLLISAIIDNRKRIGAPFFPSNYKDVIEEKGQFDGTKSNVYKNFLKSLPKWNEWYGEGKVMQYMAKVYLASSEDDQSPMSAVSILKSVFNITHADKITAYHHVQSKKINLYGKYTIHFDIPKGSWIKGLQTSTNITEEDE